MLDYFVGQARRRRVRISVVTHETADASQLLRSIQAGDRAAFDRLVQVQTRRLLAIAHRITGDETSPSWSRGFTVSSRTMRGQRALPGVPQAPSEPGSFLNSSVMRSSLPLARAKLKPQGVSLRLSSIQAAGISGGGTDTTLTRGALRDQLGVKNERLGETLERLEK